VGHTWRARHGVLLARSPPRAPPVKTFACAMLGAFLMMAAVAPATAASASDDARLEGSNLRLADFPAGLEETPASKAAATAPPIAACDRLRAMQHRTESSVNSALFSDSSGPSRKSIAASITLLATRKVAKRNAAELMSASMLRCLTRGTIYQVRHSDPSAHTDTRVHEIDVPRVGDDARAIEHTIRVTDDVGTSNYVGQIEFIRVGPLIAALHVNTDGTVDYTSLRDRLARVLASRMRSSGRANQA
jgi:hypothetical protein